MGPKRCVKKCGAHPVAQTPAPRLGSGRRGGSPQILFSRFLRFVFDKAAGGGDGSKASTVANGSQTLREKMWWQMRVVEPAREAAAPERQPSDLALEKRLACGRSQSPRLCVCVILLFDDDLVD